MFTNTKRIGQTSRIATLALLAFAATAVPAQAQAAGGKNVKAEVRLKPGQQYTGSLEIHSQSRDMVRVHAEVLDFDLDETATPPVEQSEDTSASCKGWLTLNLANQKIRKDGLLNVPYTLRPEANLREGSYVCAAEFRTLPPASQQTDRSGVKLGERFIATIYVTIGSPAIQVALKEIKVEAVPSLSGGEAGLQAVVVLQNQGKTYYQPNGKFEILNSRGEVIETADFPTTTVLRERNQRFPFPMTAKLTPGSYTLRARVDIGNGKTQQLSTDMAIDRPSPTYDASWSRYPVWSSEVRPWN